MNYILHDHDVVEEPNIIKWAYWFETTDRRVALTEKDGVKVSTVFLGIDHSLGAGEPQLFETMVFGGESDGDQERCSTWDQAEKQHADMVHKVFGE